MASRLGLYNEALRNLGERKLANLTEDREPRYLLDDVWDENTVRQALAAGFWRFAKRTQQLDYDPSITMSFGYSRAFAVGSDWVKTMAICSDEYFNAPLLQYSREGGYIYCDLDTIYVQFVSDDSAYGGDLAIWPEQFTSYVAALFAFKIALKLTGDIEREKKAAGLMKYWMKEAKSNSLLDDPPKFPPDGSWVSARRGRGSYRDGGSTTNLIG